MARQFVLPVVSEEDSFVARLKTTASAARQLANCRTFREHFSSKHALWTAVGIAYLLQRNPELSRIVEGMDRFASMRRLAVNGMSGGSIPALVSAVREGAMSP